MEKKIYHPHIWLYAKGHYKVTDEFEDLRKIFANYTNAEPQYISNEDVLYRVISIAINAVQLRYSNPTYELFCLMYHSLPSQSWRFGGKEDDSNELCMLRNCLSTIRCSSVDKGELNIKPDANILPLKHT